MAFSTPALPAQGFKRRENESWWNYQVRGTETIDLEKSEEKTSGNEVTLAKALV